MRSLLIDINVLVNRIFFLTILNKELLSTIRSENVFLVIKIDI